MLLKPAEVASYLGISRRKATEMISTGKIPGVRLPLRTGLRVRVEQLASFIDDHTLPYHSDRPDVQALRDESRRCDAANRRRQRKPRN